MRKFLGLCLVVFFAFSFQKSFAQENVVVGGFEASGHIFSGAGWQRFRTPGGAQAVTRDVNAQLPGVIGAYADTSATTARVNREDVFRFFIDEVEFDIAKNVGEHIRLRADLDFGSATLYSGARYVIGGGNLFVEQAYAAAMIHWGNGIELMAGRFAVPIGFESVDVVDNDSISRSALYRALRPHYLTGAKIYYPFTNILGLHFYGTNNGFSIDDGDALALTTDIPAVGGRLDWHWGEEGKQHKVGLNALWGQDHGEPRKSAWTFMTDLDFNLWAMEDLAIGGEILYRQINRITLINRNDGKYFGGLLNFHYDLSDIWSGAFKYAYTHDINGVAEVLSIIAGAPRQSLTGADQSFHEFSLAANYNITEGAKFRLEGSYTFNDPSGNVNNRHIYGFGGGLAYSF